MELKNKNILVTGACGFIGSHLVERLIAEGCRVRAFVFYNSFSSWGWLDNLHKDILSKIEIFAGDIRDPHYVKKTIDGADMVFHLAALIGIPFSYHSPDSYIDTNVKGTLNILQSCKELKTKKVIITSTSEVYGTAKYVPIDEKHPLQGQSPYSASKIAADKIAESFYLSFGVPVVTARPFNTYGPRQSCRAVIPAIITQLLSGKSKINLGALHPSRDFLFVKDTAEAFISIAKSDKVIGEVINIAAGSEISIGELAQKIINIVNPKAEIVKDKKRIRPRNSEIGRLLGSGEKIKRLTLWQPKYSFDEGLKETIKWFKQKKNYSFYKPNIYNV